MPRARSTRTHPTLRWAGIAVLALVALLYYRPMRAWVDTHGALDARRAEVRALARENALLEHKLAASSSPAVLQREARALGYVKRGEHLYVVQGIEAWRRHLRATLRRNG
jgi:cell division protein FtsB